MNEKIKPYTQARKIFHLFNVGESAIFTAEVRAAFMTIKSRNKNLPQKFTSKKLDEQGYRITRTE